jgi:hypothetical protein
VDLADRGILVVLSDRYGIGGDSVGVLFVM